MPKWLWDDEDSRAWVEATQTTPSSPKESWTSVGKTRGISTMLGFKSLAWK